MFGLFANDTEHLDNLITIVTDDMERQLPESDGYQRNLATLERLTKLKTESRPERVSRDTIAMIAGNLAGILVIVAYEQKHVMVSKAFGTVIKPR